MYVVNFDFSDHFLPVKLLAINLPVFVTQLLTYPLQRLQTLLVSKSQYTTKNQYQESQYILRSMFMIEKFPKLLHGMRYSVDYTATQMTTKFLIFDFLIEKTIPAGKSIQNAPSWMIYANCYIANALSIVFSQIAFNYQTLASSLPIDKENRSENVKIKLQKYTTNKKIPIEGLKYTIPVSLINTSVQLFVISQIAKLVQIDNINYVWSDFFTAFCILTTTSFASHYAFLRQVEICNNMKERSIKYTKGLLGTLIRQNFKGLALFGMYLSYFQWKTKSQIQNLFQKRDPRQRPQGYRM